MHVLSVKSAGQRRNVFIWSSSFHMLALGWHVDDHLPMSVSACYRWINTAMRSENPRWQDVDSYTLFPIEIQPSSPFRYGVRPSGSALSRESQEAIVPGDYGIFRNDGSTTRGSFMVSGTSFSHVLQGQAICCPELVAQTSFPSCLVAPVLNRDRQCVFSRAESGRFDELVTTWIFPPSLGYTLSEDRFLVTKYHTDSSSCDFSQFMVINNALSVHKTLKELFWDNKFGVDVDDNYRIIVFDPSEGWEGAPPLKSHLTLVDGLDRPSDQFLRLHFQTCIVVYACGGDISDDYPRGDIDGFMDELGVLDNRINLRDPRWDTPLGTEVYSYILRDKLGDVAEMTEGFEADTTNWE